MTIAMALCIATLCCQPPKAVPIPKILAIGQPYCYLVFLAVTLQLQTFPGVADTCMPIDCTIQSFAHERLRSFHTFINQLPAEQITDHLATRVNSAEVA